MRHDMPIPEKTEDYVRELTKVMEAIPGGVSLTRQYGGYFAETDEGWEGHGRHDPLSAVRVAAGINSAYLPAKKYCPDCGALLEHGGMSIPVYDCVGCGNEWAIYEDGSVKRVYEGYPDETGA